MRVLFLSFEFNAATFSGNGVYSVTQARALTKLAHFVLVLCATPAVPVQHYDERIGEGTLRVVQVPVSRWGRLDSTAPYDEFAAGCLAEVDAVLRCAPFDVAAVVDWSALPAWHALQAATSQRPTSRLDGVPLVWLNYRVFSRHETGAGLALVKRLEAQAMDEAAESVALSAADADFLSTRVMSLERATPHRRPFVLPCGLRADILDSPPPTEGKNRTFIACVVRLVPEKGAQRFIDLVGALHDSGALARLGLAPILVAPASDAFAEDIKAQLRERVPSAVLVEKFLTAAELAQQVFARAALNVHPATYDAFGMTIVEAASQGCPSLVHDAAGAVGATDLLRASHGEVLVADLTLASAELATLVEPLLRDKAALARVGQRAAQRARSWDEAANARELAAILEKASRQGSCAANTTTLSYE